MTLSKRDQKILWHPYTQHKTAWPQIAIVRGKGALLWDENDREFIDAIASWWVNPFGHGNPFIADAIYRQLLTLEHVLFGGFTHEPAVVLGEKLLVHLPNNQKKIFFSDNGSTAVEVAIKASLQFYFNQGINRNVFIAFEDAFHGDTFGAMAVSGISLYTEAFSDLFIKVIRIPVPTPGRELESQNALKKAIKEHPVAAFIFEPLVLGAAGMVMYEPAALDGLIKICKDENVRTIADEVMTGFGKTGKFFATQYLKELPDMMCLSKALTGGAIPLAVTTFSDEIYDAFLDEKMEKAFFHGHTFTANPAGCAAAIASITLMEQDETWKNINRIAARHQVFAQYISTHPKVACTRTRGIIFALEVVTSGPESYYGTLRNFLYKQFIDHGVILRPVGNIIYILPPFIITDEQLQKIYTTVEQVLDRL